MELMKMIVAWATVVLTVSLSVDAGITASEKLKCAPTPASGHPVENSDNGYHKDATAADCQAAATHGSLTYSGVSPGYCTVYSVQTYTPGGTWHMTKCPGNPGFYLKNTDNGSSWTLIH